MKRKNKMEQVKAAYLNTPSGLTDQELAKMLDLSQQQANRYRRRLTTKKVAPCRYAYVPSEAEVEFALLILKSTHLTADEMSNYFR